MSVFKTSVRVYIGDTDSGGVTYHPNYITFAERARTDMCRELGLDLLDLLQKGYMFVVRSIDASYISPSKFGDVLEIEVSVTKLGKTSVEILHKMKNQEDKREVCEVYCTLVFVSRDGDKIIPTLIPEDFKSLFSSIVN